MLINRNIVALFALPFMASATASELSIGAGAAYNELNRPGNPGD